MAHAVWFAVRCHLGNKVALNKLVKLNNEETVFVSYNDLHDGLRCGPCKYIAPILADFSQKYVGVKFLKVDVDKCQTTAAVNGIQAMPTFLFFKNKQKIDSIRGADPKQLEQMILNLMGNNIDLKPEPQRVAIGRSFPCFEDLRKNPDEVFKDTSKLILRYANNILKDPDNLKYRQIRLANAIFMEKLLPVDGAVNCFFTMRFEEMGDMLLLPPAAPLDNLHALRDALTEVVESPTQPSCTTSSPVCRTTISTEGINCITAKRRLRYNAGSAGLLNAKQLSFFQTLSSHTNQVLLYEEEELQQLARNCIPLHEFRKKAEEAVQSGPETPYNKFKDCLLLELLAWFKKEFFKWVNQPRCPTCNTNELNNVGHAEATAEERQWGASVVENYQCRKCFQHVRFPRYNHPQKLLETRMGRCGEWANCFTLCCRAAGFEARYVLDTTDHVWTEVYSESQKRWLHCDSCENTCDKPLTYETGWGKKLSYVIAFSKDEVIDVTWRYTVNHLEVLKRRDSVPEIWLVQTCDAITKELQYGYSEVETKEHTSRHIKEMVEFITPKGASGQELIGRQSGSMAWRQQRGEINEPAKTGHVFKLSEEHIREKCFRLRYNPVKDCYYTNLTDNLSIDTPTVKGWSRGASGYQNIMRNEEHDWEMVYLARAEGTQYGNLSWNVDFKDSGLCIDQVKLNVRNKCYETGKIYYVVSNGSLCKVCDPADKEDSNFEIDKFSGTEDHLKIDVHLKDGKGDVAWQHTQLFRTSVKDTSFIGLDVIITFKAKNEK